MSAGAKRVGATVNDALLSAVAGGAETALREAGQPVPPVLPASVPVALPGGHGRSGNAVGVMLARLPTGVADAADRMVRIAAVTREAKEAARDQAASNSRGAAGVRGSSLASPGASGSSRCSSPTSGAPNVRWPSRSAAAARLARGAHPGQRAARRGRDVLCGAAGGRGARRRGRAQRSGAGTRAGCGAAARSWPLTGAARPGGDYCRL